ncbi:MAG: siderophore-interacting protein, partial [Micromonosporaceae bacterium]
MDTTVLPTLEVEPWRQYAVRVRRVSRMSPSFVRVTLTGPDLDRFADNGFDQRIKLVFPAPDGGLDHLPSGPDWYSRWRKLPERRRHPIRTYTVRAVRPEVRELDVDMVRHGDAGPASRWVGAARPGDRLVVIGPNADHPGPHGGIEFRPPPDADALLLAGDETAVPAICVILTRLDPGTRGEALLEVPLPGDVLGTAAPPGVRVTWLPRCGAGHGQRLVPAVRAAVARLLREPAPVGVPCPVPDVDVDRELLWEVPEPAGAPGTGGLYAWLAGEAGVIRTLRRHLVTDHG